MKNYKKSIICLLSICVVLFNINIFAHSGRTDANGGHRDNKNVSGLGSYHYHCGGYPAHLHKNGVCPYKPKTNSSKTETKVLAESIEINEENIVIEIGETKILTATIYPINVTDDTITWNSNNEDVVIISGSGKIEGVNEGIAVITAATSNNKRYTVKVTVKEAEKTETITNIGVIDVEYLDIEEKEAEEYSVGDTILGFGVLGVIGYFGHKKHKNKK